MKKVMATVMSFGMLLTAYGAASAADASCPAEVSQAKSMIEQRQAKTQDVQAPRSLAGSRTQDVQAPRGQDVQAPRSLAGSRTQDVQAPRSQDVQAPRTQDVQAPRSQDVQAPRTRVEAPRTQDVQAPRTQDVQAPRTQDVQAPRSAQAARSDISRAASLVKEAEAACKAGNSSLASQKAKSAIDLMK